MSSATVQISQKDFSEIQRDFDYLRKKLETIDHAFAVKSYLETKGKLKGKDVTAFLNDL